MALLLGCTEEIQKDRIAKRNGPESLKVFLEQWIPLENHYFISVSIPEEPSPWSR
jgi:hypothetical protein